MIIIIYVSLIRLHVSHHHQPIYIEVLSDLIQGEGQVKDFTRFPSGVLPSSTYEQVSYHDSHKPNKLLLNVHQRKLHKSHRCMLTQGFESSSQLKSNHYLIGLLPLLYLNIICCNSNTTVL